MSGLNIVYVSFEALLPGGAARTHVTAIVDGLREQGHNVQLISSDTADSRINRYRRITAQAREASRSADVLYLRAHPAGYWLVAQVTRPGLAIVHEVNGAPSDPSLTYPMLKPFADVMRAMQLHQYKTADGLIAVTPGLGEWAREVSGKKPLIEIVPNAADTDLFRPDARGSRPKGRYVVFFSSMAPWHGLQTLVDAAQDTGWPEGVKLAIAGRSKIKSGPTSDVLWLGRLSQADLAGVVAGAIASLAPIEDFGRELAGGVAPLKLFESMAAGLPLIVSDQPYMAKLVRGANIGLVVPQGAPRALAWAVRQIAEMPAAKRAEMGVRARELCMREHSWQARGATTEAFLRECVGRVRDAGDGSRRATSQSRR